MEQAKDVLDRSYDVLTKFNNGVPPRGSCAPCWDTLRENTSLLLDKGIEYGVCLSRVDPSNTLTTNTILLRSFVDGSRVCSEYL